MRMIELMKLNREVSSYNDTDEPGEGSSARTPVAVNPEAIRCFYPRRDNRPGTRITFIDGGGFAVAEPYEAVKAAVFGGGLSAV